MKSDKPCFHLVITGGTIDSQYDTDHCTIVCHAKTVLPGYLARYAGITRDAYILSELCMKNSREIEDADRERIVDIIQGSSSQHIVVTHGSFSVFETARYLETRKARIGDKTVVLTGALRPLDGFSPTDAPFNLGAAILAAQHADPGVHVCIEGRLFAATEREVWH